METSNGYVPVTLGTIRVGTAVGCDLYLQNRVHGTVCYVLYCSASNGISSEKIEELLRCNVTRLFIRKEDKKVYLRHIESVLAHAVNDNSIDDRVRAQIVYDVSRNIIVDIFGDPRSHEHIERSRNWLLNAVEFIVKNKNAFSNIVSIFSYDYYTYTHSVNVAMLGVLFAKYLGFETEEIFTLGMGLLLHDIGKTQIDSSIINKNGRLSREELEKIRMHVELGAELLAQVVCFHNDSFFPVIQHHERHNGSGYPKGLKGEEIHTYGKIAAIIDVYDAMTTKRPYSDARKPFAALKIIKDELEGGFDKKYFDDFVLFLGSGGKKTRKMVTI